MRLKIELQLVTIALGYTWNILDDENHCLGSYLVNFLHCIRALEHQYQSPESLAYLGPKPTSLKRLAVNPCLFDETSMGGPCLSRDMIEEIYGS